MVFCNTLDSSRAVDHFLSENQISTVNYHGEVPAEKRVENLKKFKSDDEDCPTLVCTDLAARGLDLAVDHVIMFDFPLNSIDYLHRTGRTARMGAKGKVTSLVAKKNLILATQIEEAIRKNESLEDLTKESVRRDVARTQVTQQKGKNTKLVKFSKAKPKNTSGVHATSRKSSKVLKNTSASKVSKNTSGVHATSRKVSKPSKSVKAGIRVTKSIKSSGATSTRKASSGKKQTSKKGSAGKSTNSKLSVVGFRGRSSSSNKKESQF